MNDSWAATQCLLVPLVGRSQMIVLPYEVMRIAGRTSSRRPRMASNIGSSIVNPQSRYTFQPYSFPNHFLASLMPASVG